MSASRLRNAVLGLALAAGICGLRWGLPGPERLRAFPERLIPTPEVAARFAREWAKLYAGIEASHKSPGTDEPVAHAVGVEIVRPGWDFPPLKLLNSYRSLLLQSGHPDEKKSFVILSQMRPWRLEFKPLYIQYGGAFIYPLGAFLGAAHLTGLIHLTPGMEYYLLHPEDIGSLYLAGRVFMLLFQLGTVLLLFKLGERLAGARAGAAAAVLGALTPLAALNTHVIKPHPYAAFWALAACWYLLEALSRNRRRDFLACGACAGMAAGSLFSMIPLLGLPLAGLLAGVRPRKEAFMGAAAGVAVFVAANPYVLFAFKDFQWDLAYASGRELSLSPFSVVDYLQAMVVNVGLISAVLSTGGLILSSLSRSKEEAVLARGTLLILAVLLVKFSVFFSEDPAALRLFYVPVLLSFILGAVAVEKSKLPKPFKAAVFVLLLVESGLRGGVALANLHLDQTPLSTFSRAASWIEANVKPGDSVGLPRYPEPSHTPRFRYDRYELVVFQRPEALDPRKLPKWVVADDMDLERFESWSAGRYKTAAVFAPARLGPLDPAAYTPFVNQEMRVYEKNR